jgi:hypothetical protein
MRELAPVVWPGPWKQHQQQTDLPGAATLRAGHHPKEHPMRLLITGSRTWDHLGSINHVISKLCREATALGENLTVVHGGANGADRLASEIVRARRTAAWPVEEEPYRITPAQWAAPCRKNCPTGHRRQRAKGEGTYCPAVGMRRNEHMIRQDIDVCVAFLRGDSPGTRGCIAAAQRAGIPTTVIRWEDRDNYRTN